MSHCLLVSQEFKEYLRSEDSVGKSKRFSKEKVQNKFAKLDTKLLNSLISR